MNTRAKIDLRDVSRVASHELRDGRIRALYGHSTPQKLLKEPAEPPALLYHGTSPEAMQRIKVGGLRPMSRQYVHLSTDTEMATQVGRRKADAPIILVVNAGKAHAGGVAFYRGNDLHAMIGAAPPEQRKAVEAAAAQLRKRAGFQ